MSWISTHRVVTGVRLPTLSLKDTTKIQTRVHLRLPDHLTIDIFIIIGFAIATFYYQSIPPMAYALLVPAACIQLYRGTTHLSSYSSKFPLLTVIPAYQGTRMEYMQEYTSTQVVRVQQHIRLYLDKTKDIVARAHKAAVAVELGDILSPDDELSTLKAFRHYLAYVRFFPGCLNHVVLMYRL